MKDALAGVIVAAVACEVLREITEVDRTGLQADCLLLAQSRRDGLRPLRISDLSAMMSIAALDALLKRRRTWQISMSAS